MTITNKKSSPRDKVQDGDKIIRTIGKLALVRDMHVGRRHGGKTRYDIAYWALAPHGEEEA